MKRSEFFNGLHAEIKTESDLQKNRKMMIKHLSDRSWSEEYRNLQSLIDINSDKLTALFTILDQNKVRENKSHHVDENNANMLSLYQELSDYWIITE